MASCQYRAMCLQDYAVSDGIAKMRCDLASLSHTQPDEVRASRFGMSKDTLDGISKIDYELGRASWIDVRRKDILHLLAQRFRQGPGIRVRGRLNRQDMKQCQGCLVLRRQRSEVGKYCLGFIRKIGGKKDVPYVDVPASKALKC